MRFTEWVCEKVLPEIRRNGFYGQVAIKEQRMLRQQLIDISGKLHTEHHPFMKKVLWDQFCVVCCLLGQEIPEQHLLEDGQEALPGI